MDWWPWGRTVKTLLGVCKRLLSARRRLTQQRGGRAPPMSRCTQRCCFMRGGLARLVGGLSTGTASWDRWSPRCQARVYRGSGKRTAEEPVCGVLKTSNAAVRASLVAQRLKRLTPVRKTRRVRSLGWEDPLEKEMVTHSSILAWRIPWTEEPGRLQSTGSQRVGHG